MHAEDDPNYVVAMVTGAHPNAVCHLFTTPK